MNTLAPSSPDKNALVSIGIPTFNRADLLDRRIENVLRQTHRNLEIVISDNASPNAAVGKVVHKWSALDSRIRSFRQPVNIGAYNNFLFVMNEAKGKYFAWAADDDEWDEDYIQASLSHIGNSQLYMPTATVHYLMSDRKVPIALPKLTIINSHYENAMRFLENAQPTLLYGLHELDNLKQIMPTNTFDLADVLIVYRAILEKGVVTGGSSEYRAGVPEEAYKIKPFGRPGSVEKVSYRSATLGCLATTLTSRNLALHQRVRLSVSVVRLMIRTADHLTRTYPEVARPQHLLLSQMLVGMDKAKSLLRRLRFWR